MIARRAYSNRIRLRIILLNLLIEFVSNGAHCAYSSSNDYSTQTWNLSLRPILETPGPDHFENRNFGVDREHST